MIWFYICWIVKKYLNTTINMVIDLEKELKFVCGGGCQKGCSLWTIVNWQKEDVQDIGISIDRYKYRWYRDTVMVDILTGNLRSLVYLLFTEHLS